MADASDLAEFADLLGLVPVPAPAPVPSPEPVEPNPAPAPGTETEEVDNLGEQEQDSNVFDAEIQVLVVTDTESTNDDEARTSTFASVVDGDGIDGAPENTADAVNTDTIQNLIAKVETLEERDRQCQLMIDEFTVKLETVEERERQDRVMINQLTVKVKALEERGRQNQLTVNQLTEITTKCSELERSLMAVRQELKTSAKMLKEKEAKVAKEAQAAKSKEPEFNPRLHPRVKGVRPPPITRRCARDPVPAKLSTTFRCKLCPGARSKQFWLDPESLAEHYITNHPLPEDLDVKKFSLGKFNRAVAAGEPLHSRSLQKRGLGKPPRGFIPKSGHEPGPGMSSKARGLRPRVKCGFCTKKFHKGRGLHVHLRSKHPDKAQAHKSSTSASICV